MNKLPNPSEEDKAIESMAREARVKVSKLSKEEQKNLQNRAMQLIYGGSSAKRPVGSGHKLHS